MPELEREPFFHRRSTHELIQAFAEADKIAIYYGAGVTIDQGGLDWRSLVHELLLNARENDHPSENIRREVDAIMQNRPLVESASVASQYFIQRHGDDWQRHVSSFVRNRIYGVAHWQRGRLAQTLAILIATLGLLERDIQVITTNYDAFVEEELMTYLDSQGIETTAVVVAPGSGNAEDEEDTDLSIDRVHEFHHIHGYVSNLSKLDIRDSPYLVLSERDYFANDAWAMKTLKDAFNERAVLILGCGLDDRPLLQALATAPGGGNMPRFAIMPVPSLRSRGSGNSDEAEYKLLRETLNKRMDQFSAKVVYPDFYFQIPQLLQEVTTWAGKDHSRGPYRTSEARYGKRLVGWWDDWSARCCSGPLDSAEGWRNKQTSMQSALVKELRGEISQILGTALRESVELDSRLKLELWVRWDPEVKRELRCFCSTVSLWTDEKSMRTALLTEGSSYASVSAFVSGRPNRIFDQGEQWPTYLAVPIGIELTEGWVQVGALVLASKLSRQESGITDENSVMIKILASAMTTLGTELLHPMEPTQ